VRRALCALLVAIPAAAQPVTYDRIRRSAADSSNWLTYSGNYQGHRFSPLRQVDASTVARLKPAWMYQVDSPGNVETSPLVVDGIMYVTEPMNVVTALDTRTGRPLWKYRRTLPEDLRLCCGKVNRGLAVLGDSLFLGTLDAHLVALDSRTGRVRWDVQVEDYRTGHSITGAPLAINGKVVTGIAGGELGIRGFVDAYDASSGKRLWRFYTIPGPGERGHDTWQGDSWKTGGAPTWVTGSYDDQSDTVFWGTGNPGPDWNADSRQGDNLYSDSLVALDGATGKLRWHFQFTPHDDHDWDSVHVPVLFESEVRGKPRKLVALANRNAFYYVLDRETGEFISGKPYVKQTWAKGLDDHGRPLQLPGTSPTPEGTVIYPSMNGATIWFSPAYSPQHHLFYVAAREVGSIYVKTDVEYRPGAMFTGGGERGIPGDEAYGAIRALEPATGSLKWEFRLLTPPVAGLLATAGGLVFGGANEGAFFALDALTGKPLWTFQTGGQIIANPVSYLSDGKQQIAIAAGHAIMAFGLE
jgi:alcohol dehydrogenase (cytochrome c)